VWPADTATTAPNKRRDSALVSQFGQRFTQQVHRERAFCILPPPHRFGPHDDTAQREAERWILTVRRASEILDVSQLEVANAAWWQGIRWLACRTRPRGSRRCCAAALPGRTLTRWSYAA